MRFFRRTRNDALHAQVDDLARRLGTFERACEEVGIRLKSAAGDGVRAEVPPSFVAATRCRRSGGEPVRLDIGNVPMIAVVSGEGDPQAWFDTLGKLAHPSYAARSDIPRIGHCAMPAGLLMVVRRHPGTAYWAAEGLGAGEQHAAVLTARRAARRQGWPAPGMLPVAAFGAAAVARAAKGTSATAAQALRAHAATAAKAGAAAAVAAGAGVTVAYLPAYTTQRTAAAPPAASRIAHRRTSTREGRSPARHRSLAGGRAGEHPGAALAGRGKPPSPGQHTPGSSPSPAPSPHPSPGVTVKVTVRPSPSPSHPLAETCVVVPLVGRVCTKL